MDESKLIFYTGAPGSKWSAVAHLLSMNNRYSINTSDYSEDKVYTHGFNNISHLGAYWGPGNGIGENFHQLSSMSKDQILYEIDKPYKDKNQEQYRLIKCHHFGPQLDYITEIFPTSKIIIVLRPDLLCFRGWIYAGGFEKITYPDYHTFYKNKEILEKKIQEENFHARDFIYRKQLAMHVVTQQYWKEIWNIDLDTKEKNRYIRSIDTNESGGISRWNFDTTISHYNFKGL